MKNLAIRLFLYTCIALVPISCGTRKAQTEISKTTDSFKEQESSKGSVTKESNSSESSKSSEHVDKVNEQQEQRITELFNDNGSLKQRITELLNSKSTDRSIKSNETLKTIYIRTDSVFNNNHYKTITYTVYSKSKSTQRSNNGIYVMLGAIAAFAILVFAVYKYITRAI
jgi:hypothetical protein